MKFKWISIMAATLISAGCGKVATESKDLVATNGRFAQSEDRKAPAALVMTVSHGKRNDVRKAPCLFWNYTIRGSYPILLKAVSKDVSARQVDRFTIQVKSFTQLERDQVELYARSLSQLSVYGVAQACKGPSVPSSYRLSLVVKVLAKASAKIGDYASIEAHGPSMPIVR